MGTRASTLRPGPEVEAPSRAASPVSSTSPTLWSRGHRAAPTLLGPAQTVVVAWINVVMRSCKIANANLFQGTFPCGQEPQRLGAHPCKVRKGRRSPLSFWQVRGPYPPRPTPLNARTPQTGLMLKTPLFFGFFVCFEFIQSLRNLWFWLEI